MRLPLGLLPVWAWRRPGHSPRPARPSFLPTTGKTRSRRQPEEAYAEMEKNLPMGRAGRPEEIASAVLWLCSPGASYVVGHALTVAGGSTVG
jgi:NAD(P)-dependent dehydrogenase (short-subunit alcohol dehydrogenase family)